MSYLPKGKIKDYQIKFSEPKINLMLHKNKVNTFTITSKINLNINKIINSG